jgi:glycine/D-amino acid oxidase-like deaminating enzyme
MQQFDVVVIGAGVGGLAAAYYLREARPNIRLVVLEARHVRFSNNLILYDLSSFQEEKIRRPGSQSLAPETFPHFSVSG